MMDANVKKGRVKPEKRVKIYADKRVARSNAIKLIVLGVLVLTCIALFLLLGLNFSKMKFITYSLQIRVPKLISMLIAAFAIGSASVVFQTINGGNRIITPCLLGIDTLYTMTHTAVVFCVGIGSILVVNANLSFAIDLVIMAVISTIVYNYMFKLTKHNVLYILLIGTVLTSLFGSIQSTLVMVMDPTDYEVLLTSLVASFDNVNAEIIIFSVVLLAAITVLLWPDIRNLDVMTLGKSQAINLGVNYDRSVRRMLLGTTLFIAVATAMVGPLSFLGLIIANLAREFLKTFRHWQLILASTLFGMLVLIGGQVLVERVFNYSVPVSVFISLIGGAYFLYLLLRKKKA